MKLSDPRGPLHIGVQRARRSTVGRVPRFLFGVLVVASLVFIVDIRNRVWGMEAGKAQ